MRRVFVVLYDGSRIFDESNHPLYHGNIVGDKKEIFVAWISSGNSLRYGCRQSVWYLRCISSVRRERKRCVISIKTRNIHGRGIGIIASFKRKYKRRKIERAIDLLEEGVTQKAMMTIHDIWGKM